MVVLGGCVCGVEGGGGGGERGLTMQRIGRVFLGA